MHSCFATKISQELALSLSSVNAVLGLLQEGGTIPFIARYRKEATGNLDEVEIKKIEERFDYWKELESRRETILKSIESQGKLTESLKIQILECSLKTLLEDLYLPYKPKRRTRAMIAREKGLEPLAQLILKQASNEDPRITAESFINEEKGVGDIEAALAGARDIIAEIVSEDIQSRKIVRDAFALDGILISKVRLDKKSEATKFEQYYDFKESVRTIPSHRYLAIRRGEREEILDVFIEIDPESAKIQIEKQFFLNASSPSSHQLKLAIEDALKRLLLPSVETDIRLELKLASDKEAVQVFADNLQHLLLAAPLGGYCVIGIDPGIRTGCKCAVVDPTGKYLTSATLFLAQGDTSINESERVLKGLVDRYQPYAIAIGNGTAGRDTEAFIRRFLNKEKISSIIVVSVNESGASIYSASDVAREEFPELDLTIRGAISIARRLQDPLAELVKIDPKSIGVGQYQHDVHQPLLQDQLQHSVEICVNRVGVDLNRASASLLSYVSGIGPSLAKKVISHRELNGAFKNRKQIRDVSGFGAKTFEQSAGFLRILDGDNPLDASAVHPERYSLVEQMARDLNVTVKELVTNPSLTSTIDSIRYTQLVGEFTLSDIIQELKKPGRDPRAVFEPPAFREDIQSIHDLKIGVCLEGIVTNVTAFGAFVDVGIHQDGLIHLSELSDMYIKHPNEVVSAGQRIKVEVLSIDVPRRRIALTAKIGRKRDFIGSDIPLKEPKINVVKTQKKSFSSNPFNQL